jgi:hypothetical protein
MKITTNMIKNAYSIGKLQHEGSLTLEEASTQLEDSGMNKNSAKYYLYAVTGLLSGNTYGGTISQEAIEYFLAQISAEYGKDRLILALKAFESHLDKQANILVSQREVLDYYKRGVR